MKHATFFLQVWLLNVLCLGTWAMAAGKTGELVMVDQGASPYEIVLPVIPRRADDFTDRHVRECAQLLQDCLWEATGVRLPMVSEPDHAVTSPGIYLGDTSFARSHQVDPSAWKRWQYLHQTVGRDVILAGLDARGPVGRERTYYSIGTMKAVTAFLQERLGVKFLLPTKNGIHVPRCARVTMPVGRRLRRPNLEFSIGVHPGNPYSIANNFYHAPYYNSHGGHSYYDAVPTKIYGKTHPEYFAWYGGRRNPRAHHLCISNPQVQELIYQELVRELDRGFDMTELGQTDGYIPCQCEKCRKLFNQESPGEKLWILHRSFARRLMRDRPGKQIVMLAYASTSAPPVSFSSFPPNVIIELCDYSEKNFSAWSKLEVPGGFMTYVYNWGNYQLQGFTAKFGPRSCAKQIRLFHKHHVRGLYRCGFGELFGMEGPLYYAWGRGFDRPDAESVQPLLEEFYQAAYGAARAPMRRFFTVLYDRLDYMEQAQMSSPALTNACLFLSMVYSPDVLLTMERNLARAEATKGLTDKERARIYLVRANFRYTRNLARIMTLYQAHRLEPSAESFNRLAAEIEERNRMIEPIRKKVRGATAIKGWPGCPFQAESYYIQTNGRLRATINAPLNWDIAKFRRLQIIPGISEKRVLKAVKARRIPMDVLGQAGPWQSVSWRRMSAITEGERISTRFKLLYDDDALFMAFDCQLPPGCKATYVSLGKDGPVWEQECLEILLDPEGNRERYRHFIFNPVPDSWFDASYGYITDPLHPLYNKPDASWNGTWEYQAQHHPSEHRWTAVVRIPFKALGLSSAPEQGTVWTCNFGREHISRPQAVPELHLWSPSQETSSFHDPDSYGELVF